MGIFNRRSDDARIKSLVEQARGDSVTKKRLTSISPGLRTTVSGIFENHSVIKYLEENEQPHHCFTNGAKGITRNGYTVGKDKASRSMAVVTNRRVLFFAKSKTGEGIPLDAILNTEVTSGMMKYRLDIDTKGHSYTFYINNKFNFDEIESCSRFIQSQSNKDTVISEENTKIGDLEKPWEQSLADISSLDNIIADEPRGDYVTSERVKEVRDILDPDEVIHFLTQGSTVDVEGSGAGSSLFGDDRGRKVGTDGLVITAVTDRRVAVKVPQYLGDDERSVPYDSITSVDLDTGLAYKRMTLQTAGQTYHIEAQEPGKEEVREVTQFIRKKRKEANEQEVVVQQSDESSEPDPLAQLEKLKELQEAGAISEDEFDKKKQDLLDKI